MEELAEKLIAAEEGQGISNLLHDGTSNADEVDGRHYHCHSSGKSSSKHQKHRHHHSNHHGDHHHQSFSHEHKTQVGDENSDSRHIHRHHRHHHHRHGSDRHSKRKIHHTNISVKDGVGFDIESSGEEVVPNTYSLHTDPTRVLFDPLQTYDQQSRFAPPAKMTTGRHTNRAPQESIYLQDEVEEDDPVLNVRDFSSASSVVLPHGVPTSSSATTDVMKAPWMWSISYDQLLQLRDQCSEFFTAAEFSKKTMGDVVDHMIKPICANTGKSFAMSLNPNGLLVSTFVTHAWAEPFEAFVDSIELHYSGWVDKPNLWICAFALVQGESETIEEQLNVPLKDSPFLLALKRAETFLVVRNSVVDLYSRIWCVFELFQAREVGLVTQGKTFVVGPDTFAGKTTSCMNAEASNLDDQARILAALLQSKGGYREVDGFVNKFRAHKFTTMTKNAARALEDRKEAEAERAKAHEERLRQEAELQRIADERKGAEEDRQRERRLKNEDEKKRVEDLGAELKASLAHDRNVAREELELEERLEQERRMRHKFFLYGGAFVCALILAFVSWLAGVL